MDKPAPDKKFWKGYGLPVSIALCAGVFSVAGCVTTKQPEYEICNSPNCGDNVTVEVTK